MRYSLFDQEQRWFVNWKALSSFILRDKFLEEATFKPHEN